MFKRKRIEGECDDGTLDPFYDEIQLACEEEEAEELEQYWALYNNKMKNMRTNRLWSERTWTYMLCGLLLPDLVILSRRDDGRMQLTYSSYRRGSEGYIHSITTVGSVVLKSGPPTLKNYNVMHDIIEREHIVTTTNTYDDHHKTALTHAYNKMHSTICDNLGGIKDLASLVMDYVLKDSLSLKHHV